MVSYKCSLYFAIRNKRDGKIEPGFENFKMYGPWNCGHVTYVLYRFFCLIFLLFLYQVTYEIRIYIKRRCDRRAGRRYVGLQDFLTLVLFAWPLRWEGRYFSVKVFDVSTTVFFRNLLPETMPKFAVKLSNVVFSFELRLFTFPNLYVHLNLPDDCRLKRTIITHKVCNSIMPGSRK